MVILLGQQVSETTAPLFRSTGATLDTAPAPREPVAQRDPHRHEIRTVRIEKLPLHKLNMKGWVPHEPVEDVAPAESPPIDSPLAATAPSTSSDKNETEA